MASRAASSSLRRRFLWTIAVIALVVMASIAAIVLQPQPNGPPRPPLLAVVEQPPDVPPGPKPAGDYFSPRFGYELALDNTPWKRWENLADVVPEADCGALLQPGARLLVIPLALGELKPQQEALNHALLARLGIAYPSNDLVEFRPIEHDGAAGHAFRFVREVSGVENTYHAWVLRRAGCAYLVAAWLERTAGDNRIADEAALDDALGKLSFDEQPSDLDVSDLAPPQRLLHGLMYDDLGRFALESRDYSAAVSFFKRALELRPDDPVMLSNLVSARVESKQYAEALDELEQQLPRFPNHGDLQAGRAFLLAELGKSDDALNAYQALFDAGYSAEGPFTQYVNLLAQQAHTAQALQEVDKYLKSRDSFTVRRMQATLLRQQGDHQGAIAILSALQEGRPFSAELAYDLADSLCTIERYQDALDVCRRLVEHHYDTAHTYVLQARCHFGLKHYADAKDALQRAIQREPAHPEAQELLALVGGMLGEGSHAAVSEPIEPVLLPDTLASLRPPVVDQPQLRPYGAYLLRRHVAIEFEPQKCFALTDRRTIRLLDPAAVARFSTIQIPFDPLSERLYVNSLRVLDQDGNEVAAGKTSDYYVTDAARPRIATHAKTLSIPVPALEPGHTIDLVLTRRDVAPPARFPYTSHFFNTDIPVLSALVYVRADESLLQFKASPEVRLDRVEGGMAWRIDDPPVYRDEPLGQPRDVFSPRLVLADRTTTWGGLATEYLASIEDRLQSDEVAHALSRQLTDGLADRPSQVAALVQHVQDTLTYKPIEFGRRARVPGRAGDVLRNKYGDCKDHSLLLVQLLRGCGIDARLVLASLDAPVDPDIAALDQFDHMLVFIPGNGRDRFVDCTDKDSDLLSLETPLDLGGKRVLVLDPAEPRLVQLPGYRPASSRIHVARQVRLLNERDALVDENVSVQGHHAAFLRNLFKTAPPANRAAMLQEELSPYADSMQMRSLEIENLPERGRPLLFKASYVVANRFQPAGDTVVGHLPALWERMYLGVQPVPDRQTPFEIEYPLEFASAVELIVPDQYVAESQVSGDQSQSSFAAWRTELTPFAKGLRMAYELRLPAGRYPASDYAAYHDELERAVAVLSQPVVLKKR